MNFLMEKAKAILLIDQDRDKGTHGRTLSSRKYLNGKRLSPAGKIVAAVVAGAILGIVGHIVIPEAGFWAVSGLGTTAAVVWTAVAGERALAKTEADATRHWGLRRVADGRLKDAQGRIATAEATVRKIQGDLDRAEAEATAEIKRLGTEIKRLKADLDTAKTENTLLRSNPLASLNIDNLIEQQQALVRARAERLKEVRKSQSGGPRI